MLQDKLCSMPPDPTLRVPRYALSRAAAEQTPTPRVAPLTSSRSRAYKYA
jgi:hypothetical protein